MSAVTAGKLLLGAASVAVFAAVIAAVTLEPPHLKRQYRLDDHRTSDLAAINRAVSEYWKRHSALPPSLAVLAAEPGMDIEHKDPETAIAYEYQVTGKGTFRLCANFAQDSRAARRRATEFEWAHSSGRQCFDRVARNKAE